MSDVHPNVSRVVSAAKERGLEINTKRFPEGTKTAADAAAAIALAESKAAARAEADAASDAPAAEAGAEAASSDDASSDAPAEESAE